MLEHPFILGTLVKNSKIDGSCSPTSILDIGMYDCDYDSNELKSFDEGESLYINPFSIRHCIQRNGQQVENGLETLDDHWIIVSLVGHFKFYQI